MSGPSGRRPTALLRLVVGLQVALLVGLLVAPAGVLAADPSDDPSASAPAGEQPSAEPTSESTPAPTPEPTAEPPVEPATEPPAEPTPPPTAEPTAEPTPAPAEQPAPSGPPTIASDLADYPPGGLVTLTGSGWQPGEVVHITVNDDAGSTWTRSSYVTADASGVVIDVFNLPDWFVALYTVVAIGNGSGTALTTFTDGNVQVQTNSGGPTVTLTYTRFDGLGCAGTVTAGPTSVTISPTSGSTNQFSQNTGSFRLAVPGSPGGFSFVDWTAQGNFSSADNPLCFDAINGNRTFTANYIAVVANVAPTAANKTATTTEDGGAITITLNATDTGTCELTFATAGATNGTLGSITNQACVAGSPNSDSATVQFTPTADFNGTASFTYAGSDGTLTSPAASVTVTVRPVNDAPTANGTTVTTNEDNATPVNLGPLVADGETSDANLSYSIVTGPTKGVLSGTAPTLMYTPNENANGADSFQYTVTDRGDPDACGVPVANVCAAAITSGIATVAIAITAVNDVPTAASQSVTTAEDTAKTITLSGTDVEGSIIFAIVTPPAAGGLSALGVVSCSGTSPRTCTTNVLYTPDPDVNGPDTFSFKVNDGTVDSAAATVSITVTEVNDVPVSDADSITVLEDSGSTAVDVLANDSAGPANESGQGLTIESVTTPSHGTAVINGTAIDYTPAADYHGADTFTYVVCDDGTTNGLLDKRCTVSGALVNVTVSPVNDAPVLDPIGNKSIAEGSALTFTAGASDIDGDGLSYSLSGAPAGATIGLASGAFSWTPTEAQGPGSFTFTVQVTDDGTPTLSDSETITVNVSEVNEAPVLAAIGPQSVAEGSALSFTASATDSDVPANSLTYSLVGAPAGATIAPTSGAFSWTPTEAQGPGSFTFTVQVTDNGTPNRFDTESITITVSEVNEAPVLDAIGDQTTDEAIELTFSATASDPDLPANGLTFSLDGAPAGASIDGSSGAFSWTPTEAQGPGDYPFDVCVTDDGSPQLDDCESISVHVDEVNLPPVLDAIGNQSVDEGSTLTFTAAASDPDLPANGLAFSLVGAPAAASIDPSSGAFSWTPADDASVTFDVCVTDDGVDPLADCETITVTVDNVDPIVDAGTGGTLSEGGTFTSSGSFVDPGADTWTATVDYGDGSGVQPLALTGKTFALSHVYADDGPFTVTVTVLDDDGGADDDTALFTVTNIAPTIALSGAATTNEGATYSLTFGTITDPGTDTVTSLIVHWGDGSPSQTYGPDDAPTHVYADGPASHTITVDLVDEDGTHLNAGSLGVSVANVAPSVPTVTITFDPFTHLAIATATYTDPGVDTHTASFDWGAFGATTDKAASGGSVADSRTLPNGCFTITVVVTVKDSDGQTGSKTGTFAGSADAYAVTFEAPIKDNERNVTKYGNVVPVKVRITSSCTGASITTPQLYLTVVKGSYDDVDEGTNVVATSVSAADTDNRMRLNGAGYIYNLSTKGFTAGSDYTVRVRLGASDGLIIQSAVLQPKK